MTLNLRADVIELNGKLKMRMTAKIDEKIVELDELNVGNAAARERFAERLADLTGIAKDDVEQELLLVADRAAEAAGKNEPEEEKPSKREIALAETPNEILAEARDMLASDDLFDRIVEDAERLGAVGESVLIRQLYCVATSRLLSHPLAAHVQGASSAGKSFIPRIVASMMPDEEMLLAHHITPQALYHMPPGSLRHILVVAGERERERGIGDRAQFGSKALREMLGDGVLRKLVTIKGEDGRLTASHVEQEGPIAYIESSTAGTLHEEDRNRMMVLQIDESPAQTEAIIQKVQTELSGKHVNSDDRHRVQQVHRTAQRLLDRELVIIIPFAECLRVPVDRVVARRVVRRLGTVIQTVAFLRQFQKERFEHDNATAILADATDYRITLELMRQVIATSFDPLDTLARETLSKIEEAFHESRFTRLDLASKLGISESHASRRVMPLVANGLLAKDDAQRPHHYQRTDRPPADPVSTTLASPEEVERICGAIDDKGCARHAQSP